MITRISMFMLAALVCEAGFALSEPADSTSVHELKEVTVKGTSTTRRMTGAVNGVNIGREELFRAACCNLGESFTTNPSVDVSYSDAATGAKQIRLLGLSGTYVQMLTEAMPNYRGAASPYALGYVPGPWMKNIAVSKGCSSVKNGYESITGQINIDYLKPEDEQTLEVNLFGDTDSRLEANVTGNIHIGERWSTVILTHYEDIFSNHDGNDDGFYDRPDVKQVHVDNRWVWQGEKYIFHAGVSYLNEDRHSGQLSHAMSKTDDEDSSVSDGSDKLYGISMETNRLEGYMKHAFVLDAEHGTNIAFMGSVSLHEFDALYGNKTLYINQKNAYGSLIFETSFTDKHSLSAGLSINHDYYNIDGTETTSGVYAQYTLTTGKVTAMAGVRLDDSDVYGTFITPRFHIKYMPFDQFSVRLSAGKGYRSVHALAENSYLLASSRSLVIDELNQESAWNYGVSAALVIPIGRKTLKMNAEYYYTHFSEQAVIDYDSNPNEVLITRLSGRSYSHTAQVDASYPVLEGLTLTAAYRLNRVMSTYGGKRMSKPLTNKYKGLLTATYKTPLELWQVDVTLQLNGGGRMPTPYTLSDGSASWSSRFHAYEQLSAQVTRWFRHFSLYIGGENLTGFKQKEPIISASDPWGDSFDATMVWGPIQGAMLYAGVRINI